MTTIASTSAKPTPVSGPRGSLAGVGALLRFDLRRERIRTPVWVLAIVVGSVMVGSAYSGLYATAQERASAAQTMQTPAALAMLGPRHYLDHYTFGGMLGHQMLGYLALAAAGLSILIVVRNTRTEEETGRAELLRSTVVGRHAQLGAALIIAVIANLVLALTTGLALAAMRIDSIDLAGSLLYGSALGAVGMTFAGIAAITVQVTAHARGAIGMAIALAGLAYVLRAAGDVSESEALSWVSPVGWAQHTYAFLDNRWWPLSLAIGLAVITAAAGFVLSTCRDVGSGLRAARQGRAHASALLGTPIGHAVRLHRGMLLGFAVGVFVLGGMYGSILGSAADMLAGVEQLDQALQDVGGRSVAESFASLVMIVMAVIVAVFAVIAALRPRSEEAGGRAESVLATGLSRQRWVLSHVAVAAVGSALLLALTGFGFGLSGAASMSDAGLIGILTTAALAYAPALWIVIGVAVALYGWFPRIASVAWVVVIYGFVVGYLGKLLKFPEWTNKISPFGQVPQLPAADMSWTPEVIMTLIAAVLVMIGLIGFHRRDLWLK